MDEQQQGHPVEDVYNTKENVSQCSFKKWLRDPGADRFQFEEKHDPHRQKSDFWRKSFMDVIRSYHQILPVFIQSLAWICIS